MHTPARGDGHAPGTPPAAGSISAEQGRLLAGSSARPSDARAASSADLAPAEGKGRAGAFEI